MYIDENGSVRGGMPNPFEKKKQLAIKQGVVKMVEPNMVTETKEEVIDTIAKKDFSKETLIQNQCMGCPRSMLFVIKKGDPIQVIKTTKIGTLQTDVFYYLKNHNGQDYAKTIAETPKQPIKDNSNFKGWASLDFSLLEGQYSLPKDVVEQQTIVGKLKDIVSVNTKDTLEKNQNKNILKVGLIALVGYVVYKLLSEDKV